MDRVRRTIKFDGLIQLQCADGFLSGAGIEGSRLFLRSPAVNETGDEVFPFFHFSPNVFRVVQTRSALKNAARLMNRSIGAGVTGDPAATLDKEASSHNSSNGGVGDDGVGSRTDSVTRQEITYGMVFSLVHAASNLYVSVVHSQRSQNDPDCVSVVLSPAAAAASPSCEFTFVSRYKIHSDGDKVTRDDEVLIRLAAKPLFLHVSSPRELNVLLSPEDIAVLDRTFRLGSRLTFYKVPKDGMKQQLMQKQQNMFAFGGPMTPGGGLNNLSFSFSVGGNTSVLAQNSSPLVLQALTREYLDEVNGCEEGGVSFTLHRYDAEVDKAMAQCNQLHLNHTHIPCGAPVAFFHRERESFLTTSVTAPRPYVSHASALVDTMDEPPRLRKRRPRTTAEEVVALTGAEGQIHEMALQGNAAKETNEDAGEGDSPTVSGGQTPLAQSPAVSMTGRIGGGGATLAPPSIAPSAHTLLSQRTEKAAAARLQRRIRGLIDGGDGQLLPYPTFAVTPSVDDTEIGSEQTLADESCNINALWMIEGEDPTHGGPVKIGNTYRIKHIYTGLYLAVCGSAVDDIFQDEDDLSDGHLASERSHSVSSSMDGHAGEPEGQKGPVDPKDTLPEAPRLPSVRVNTSFRAGFQETFRETALCLIMEPRSHKDLERTLFTFEYMFASDATYLFEQDSIVLKNLLTGMFVATDGNVAGPNIKLQLQWQHRPSDTIVASSVPGNFQRSALFIRQQCIWLSRYREQMQAAAVDMQRDMQTLKRAAENGNAMAAERLKREEEDEEIIRKEVAKSDGSWGPDPDSELLSEHKKRHLAEFHRKKRNKKKKRRLVNNLSFSGMNTSTSNLPSGNLGVPTAGALTPNAEEEDEDDDVEHMHPRYRSLQHTIRLCQRSLTTLICFCTASEDTNPITREGLPIKDHQRMLFDIELHKLLFEVILAPFCLLRQTYTQMAMIQKPRDWEELGSYEGTALYQTIVQRQSTDRLWDEIHLCCRLAFRLLRQMIVEDSSLSDGWEHYLPYCLALDGRRMHVIEVMQEMFSDNPRIGIGHIESVTSHFISATKAIPRSAYLKFLGAACTIGEKGIRSRQQLICDKLLVENPQLLCKFVMDPKGQGLAVIPNSAHNTKPIPFHIFFTAYHDQKMISFVHGQMRLMTRLCFDGCPAECISRVAQLLPEEGMRMALRSILTNSSGPSGDRPGHAGPLDLLRAQLIRLSFLTYVWPKVSHPSVQLRVKTVLFGSSRLRPDPHCPYLSGVPDCEIAALLKQTTLSILRANPFLVQGDDARNELLRTCITIWLRFVECKQYTQDEIQQLIPLFLNLLDGSKDMIGLHRPTTKDLTAMEAERFELSASSIPMMILRELMCKCLLGALRNEMYRSADEIIVYFHHAYTRGVRADEPKPWHGTYSTDDRASSVSLLVDNLARQGQQMQRELQMSFVNTTAAFSGALPPRGYTTLSSGNDEEEEWDSDTHSERPLLSARSPNAADSPFPTTTQEGRPQLRLETQGEGEMARPPPLPGMEHLSSNSGGSPATQWSPREEDSARHRTSPHSNRERLYYITKKDVEDYVNLQVHRIHAAFCPTRLVPLLLNVTRYKRKSLTVHSMRLLVQLTIIKKVIAQQVLMVNTLPCTAVRRGFDAIHDIAVELKTVLQEENTYHKERWHSVIERTTAALVQEFDSPRSGAEHSSSNVLGSPMYGANSSAGSFGNMTESSFLQLYSTLARSEGGSVSSFTSTASPVSGPEDDDFEAHGGQDASASDSISPARRRAKELWAKLAVVARMVVFKNTVSRRRRALGIFDGTERSLDLTVRADFMSHFKIHETLIRMLPSIPPESEAFFYTIRFFYLFSLSESTAKVLRPFIDYFVSLVNVSPRTHVLCLHVVVNILHIMNDINDYLTPALLFSFVRQIDSQVSTKLPDSDFVERLSNRVFLKTSVSVVVRRRMMLLLRQQKTLRQLSNPPRQPSPAEVTFISALVNLMCNVCGCHVSVLILARGLLPAESICKTVEKRLRRNCRKLLRSDRSFRHVTDPETVSFKLLNPYVRALVALYFTSTDDNEEDRRSRQQEWMEDDNIWNILSYYVVILNEATRLMTVQDATLGGGLTPETNRGIAGVLLYRIFFLKTIPVSVAAFFTNCYDNVAYFKRRNDAIAAGRQYVVGGGWGCAAMGFVLPELINALQRFDETLLAMDDAFQLCASDVVNARRALGVLRHVARLSEMEEEAHRLEPLIAEMRYWLARRQQRVQRQLQNEESAVNGGMNEAGGVDGDDDSEGDCLEGRESEEFEVLVKPELVSVTLQRKAAARHWRRAPRFQHHARPGSNPTTTTAAFGVSMPVPVPHPTQTIKSLGEHMGLSGIFGGEKTGGEGLLNVQEALEDMVAGDELIPSVNEDPSIVALIVNGLLLRALEDRVARECVKRVLNAMMDRLFTARTFVGLLNLFYNALECALNHPHVVDAAMEGNKGSGSPSFLPTELLHNRSLEAVRTLRNLVDSAGLGSESAQTPLSARQQAYGPNLQYIFSELGMMEVVVTLSGVEDDVVTLNALRVATALLENGNRRVQKALLRYFETREEGFFHNIRHILRKNLDWIKYINSDHQYYLLRRGLKSSAAGLESSSAATMNMQLVQALRPRGNALTYTKDPDENRRMGWAKAKGLRRLSLIWNVFRLLQLFCEGHNLGMQNYIRAQHDNLHTANMIHESMLLLREITRFITPANLPVLTQGFELLTEVCQGPCHENQEAVVDYGVCGMVTHVLRLGRVMEQHRQLQERDLIKAREAEERKKSRFGFLSRKFSEITTGGTEGDAALETYQFDDYVTEEDLGEVRKSVSTTMLSLIEGCRNPGFHEKILVQFPLQVIQEEISSVDPRQHYYIANADSEEDDAGSEALFQWLIFLQTVLPHVNDVDREQIQAVLEACCELTKYIGRVEVSREEDIEVVYFRIPPLCTSLTDDRKDVLLWQVDRTSRVTKLSDFLQKSDELIFSMEQLFAFRQTLRRWTRFRVHYDPDAPLLPGIIQRGKLFFNEFIAGALFSHHISYYEQISMMIAVAVNFVLTLVEGDKNSRWVILQHYQGAIVTTLCLVQTVVCVVILGIDLIVGYPIHLYIQYKEKQRFLAGEAKLNVTMNEVYAGLTVRERVTTLLSWFVLHLRVFFVVMAALSVLVSPYFAAFNLMLLIYKISTLRTFITAITMNGKQLVLTSFLGLIILYLFSIVGFLAFSGEFNPDDDTPTPADDAENNCQTLLRCFVYIFSQGLRAGGGVGDIMRPWGWAESDLVPRVNYDVLFYVLVNVVYLNIMFGIIIDTFGQMRDEKREKEADMHGMCFICGLESDTLEKISPSGFNTHVKHVHNMWMYLYFMHHLRRKDPSTYTGQESYVHGKIQANRLSFFPNQSCIALMELTKRDAAADSSDNDNSDDDGDDDDDDRSKGGEQRGRGGAAAAAAAGSGKALAAAARELTSLKDSFTNALKDLSGDALRLRGVLQQLELATKGGGSLFADGSTAAGGPTPSLGRQSAGTKRFVGGGGSSSGGGMCAGSERGSQTLPPPPRAATGSVRTSRLSGEEGDAGGRAAQRGGSGYRSHHGEEPNIEGVQSGRYEEGENRDSLSPPSIEEESSEYTLSNNFCFHYLFSFLLPFSFSVFYLFIHFFILNPLIYIYNFLLLLFYLFIHLFQIHSYIYDFLLLLFYLFIYLFQLAKASLYSRSCCTSS
eukprot:gene9853-6925_t